MFKLFFNKFLRRTFKTDLKQISDEYMKENDDVEFYNVYNFEGNHESRHCYSNKILGLSFLDKVLHGTTNSSWCVWINPLGRRTLIEIIFLEFSFNNLQFYLCLFFFILKVWFIKTSFCISLLCLNWIPFLIMILRHGLPNLIFAFNLD